MNHHPIHPPGHKATKTEHERAYFKMLLERIVDNHLLRVDMARKGKFGRGLEPEKAEKDLAYLLKKLFDGPDGDEEFWEGIMTFDYFMEHWATCLDEPHCGDCVAVACTCMRCFVEELYDLPPTAVWFEEGRGGKHEGAALYHDWFKSQKEKKDAAE